MWRDLVYALRTLRQNRGFAAVAVLSLALGIGANTAIFSLIDALMLRTLPVRDPGTLVDLLYVYPGDPRLNIFSRDTFRYLRERTQSLSGLIASAPSRLDLDGEAVDAELVDGNYFALLGLRPAAGRLIGAGDELSTSPAPVVLSWAYWKSHYGLDRSAIGKQITVAGAPAIIVGVAPPAFTGIVAEYRTQAWRTLPAARPGAVSLMGRLKRGVRLAQARAELAVLFRQSIDPATLRRDPNWGRVAFELERAGAGLSRDIPPAGRMRDLYAQPLQLLMAVVGLLLLIACANVANILLARGAARQREMAVRVALGARRARLVRQILTESLLLGLLGACCGGALAYLGIRALVGILATGRSPVEFTVQPDLRIVLFTAAAGLATAVLFSLPPAVRAINSAPASSLRAAGNAGDTRLGRFFGRGLVAAQVILALVLLSAAALLLRHLSNLRDKNLGFERAHILLAAVEPAGSGYSGERLAAAYREVLGRLAAIPGVRFATLSAATPISGAAASRFASVEGYRPKAMETRIFVNWVAPGYFETYATPLLSGRDFTWQDQAGSHVAVINQSMARYYFGDAPPLGRHVTLERDSVPFEIVGVVGDAKYLDLHDAPPRTIYIPTFQETGVNSNSFAVRAAGDPAALTSAVRDAVFAVMKNVPVRVRTLTDQMDGSLVPERLIAQVSTLFAALGSLLAAVGLYGLLAYTIARRTAEIGVRMALGAGQADIVRMVLIDALGIVAAGVAIGAPLAWWCAHLTSGLIAGLPSQIGPPIAWAGGVMLALALPAAFVPARRAARVDPMVALRYD